MKNSNTKKILKVGILVYLISFFILNWNDVSWIFNYRVIKEALNNFFYPYQNIESANMEIYLAPNKLKKVEEKSSQNSLEVFNSFQENLFPYTPKEKDLEIPNLNILAPIVFTAHSDVNLIKKDLDYGVVFYPGSVYPGENGNTIILGHSAPPNWPKIKYDWVFSNLNQLTEGDEILIHFRHKLYSYSVKEKIIVKRGSPIPTSNLAPQNNNLILISCWPPGKDYQRIIVMAELKKR